MKEESTVDGQARPTTAAEDNQRLFLMAINCWRLVLL